MITKNELTTTAEARRYVARKRMEAEATGRRMMALEDQAEAIHQKTNGDCRARVVVTSTGGLQALVTDGKTTIEINRGAVSVAVRE
jgi:hypothetical protein